LQEVGILQRVFSYVGPGHWLFLSTVSALWKELDCSVGDKIMQKKGYMDIKQQFTCVAQMTLYSAGFASPSRVRLANESGLQCTTTSYQYAAGKHATIASLAAAHEVGMEYQVALAAMLGAAECNQLPVLQFVYVQGCPWDTTVLIAAVQSGLFLMLCWLLECGCPCTEYIALRAAAETGNIALTAWLKQQLGVPFSEYTMAAAAAKGCTAMCAYLRAEQCPWGAYACDSAARNGSVDTLRWLHQNGCPWDADDIYEAAARSGSVDTMAYVLLHFNVDVDMLTDMLNVAGAYNKLAAAVWLRQQGAEWPAVLDYYGRVWSGDVLAWARSQGCESPLE
jgi:hypothetical protein